MPSLGSEEDAALMRLAALRDRTACERVVRRLLPRVQRTARIVLRSATDAEDASQATMVELLRSAATFRAESSLETWATRITVRTSLRWAKGERRRAQADPYPADEGLANEAGPLKILFGECLGALPEVQRVALVLRCCFGYSIEEVAELTAVSENTVKDRLRRGKAVVRHMVTQSWAADVGPTASSELGVVESA